MLFTRRERYGELIFTSRRESAFLRKQRRERESLPLLAEQIAGEQHSVDEEKHRRLEVARKTEIRMRAFTADVWRRARKLYYSQPKPIQATIRSYWIAWTGPRTAVYFSAAVDEISGERDKRLAAIAKTMKSERDKMPTQIRESIPLAL